MCVYKDILYKDNMAEIWPIQQGPADRWNPANRWRFWAKKLFRRIDERQKIGVFFQNFLGKKIGVFEKPKYRQCLLGIFENFYEWQNYSINLSFYSIYLVLLICLKNLHTIRFWSTIPSDIHFPTIGLGKTSTTTLLTWKQEIKSLNCSSNDRIRD